MTHDIYLHRQDPQLTRMEEALRAFCLKLSISDSLLQPLPSGCSFVMQIHVPEHVPNAMSTDEQHQVREALSIQYALFCGMPDVYCSMNDSCGSVSFFGG